MIKTFIFDLGKVIVPFELDNQMKILEAVCDLKHAEIREKIYAAEELLLFETGKISAEETFQSLKKTLDLRMNSGEFVAAWNSIFSLEPIVPENLIERLSKKYRLIILSDTNALHFEFIKRNFPILRFFDAFVLSYEVGFVKPSAETFQAAVEKAQCAAEECFFTDDKEANVIGAIKFGINAVQFVSAEQFEREIKNRKFI
ncbi:MAG: HAD family phosphatase [Pyrinomonadaceae bacterium]|nr:HAD family phosphatase [Pyrinomonadaceae bacterium]